MITLKDRLNNTYSKSDVPNLVQVFIQKHIKQATTLRNNLVRQLETTLDTISGNANYGYKISDKCKDEIYQGDIVFSKGLSVYTEIKQNFAVSFLCSY